MDEKPIRYVDPVNRNIDIALGILAVILLAAFLFIYNAINQNEETKAYFDINEITNEKWVSTFNDTVLEIDNNKLTLTVKGEEVAKDSKYTFNERTGEFTYKEGNKTQKEKLYLRSIGNNSITIWYNYAEYYLDRSVETK